MGPRESPEEKEVAACFCLWGGLDSRQSDPPRSPPGTTQDRQVIPRGTLPVSAFHFPFPHPTAHYQNSGGSTANPYGNGLPGPFGFTP